MGAKAFEEIWRPDGTVEKKAYIGDFAVVTETVYTSQPTTIQTDYLLRDHLGSLDVITDELGIVVTRLSFDAWGKRREVNWTVMANPTLFQPVITTRGFTGHEQLDAVGLVHMNGRVYDAELGRFLSADPFIQDTENLQAWNRYSYVLNNPLSFTDPDGFFFKKIFKAIGKAFGKIFSFLKKNFKAILRIAITGIACANPAAPLTCAAVAVGTSFAFTLASGGSIGDALQAAAFAAVSVGTFTGVGAILNDIVGAAGAAFFAVKSAVHGVVGGALSMAQGGSFLQGFATNAIGAAAGFVTGETGLGSINSSAGALLRTAIAGSAGGIAARLTGGKFENGFLAAATAHLFNAERWLVRVWYGTDAHSTLFNYLQENAGPGWEFNSGLDGLFGGKRPDITYERRELFELKGLASAAGGARQLQGYLDAADEPNLRIGNVDNVLRMLPPSRTLPSTGWIAQKLGVTTTFTFHRTSHPGVIGYTINSNFEGLYRAVNAARDRVIQGPTSFRCWSCERD